MNKRFDTLRDVVRFVTNHLLEQNKRSLFAGRPQIGNGCAYRSYDGLTCAIGCLITDEEYHVGLENCDVSEDDVRTALENSLGVRELSRNAIDTFTKLQDIHDKASPSQWEHKLHDLDYTNETL